MAPLWLVRVALAQTALGLAAFAATAEPGSGAAPEPPTIHNSREFKHLQDRARTAEDFQALAAWCQTQVSKYRADQAKNEMELADYNSKPHSTGQNPKFRPFDETLKAYIAADDKAIARWSNLLSQYSDQARKGEVASRRPARW